MDSERRESTKSAAELKITTRKSISLYILAISHIYIQIDNTGIDTEVVGERSGPRVYIKTRSDERVIVDQSESSEVA